jgi:hypothetical protein
MTPPSCSRYSHELVGIAACMPRTHVAGGVENPAQTIRLAREGDGAPRLMQEQTLGSQGLAKTCRRSER